jgi:hypothetical protein
MVVKNTPLFVELGQGLSIMVGLLTLVSWNTTERPKNAKRGTLGFNLQTSSLEYWNGSSWFEASMSEL